MSSYGNGTLVPSMGEAKASLPNKKYSHLPHIDIEGYYQFITFRTFDSLDNYLQKIYNTDVANKQKQYNIDKYLDSSKNGSCLNGLVLKYLSDFLKEQDKKLYQLIAFCIMPNHVHLLFKPLDKLSKIMQQIKGITAKNINTMLNKKGKFWASDYYDKAIRDEKHFYTTYEYIKNNPLKLGEAKASLPEGTTQGNGTLVPSNNITISRFYGVYDG